MKGCWVSREVIYVSSKRTWESSPALYDCDALSCLTLWWDRILQWVTFKNIIAKHIIIQKYSLGTIWKIGWLLYWLNLIVFSGYLYCSSELIRIKRPLVRELISNFCPLGQHSWGIENSQDNVIYRRWMAGENTGKRKQERERGGAWRSHLEERNSDLHYDLHIM